MTTLNITPKPSSRLLSLDFMRGLIMVLLMLEGAGLYEHLNEAADSVIVKSVVGQFFHHPWNGLYFWDLIQPGFMFIAGTAMAYSVSRQTANGVPWKKSFIKMLKRCCWLFFWGVLNYAVRKDGLQLALSNVLTQLSFTLLLAFLIFNWPFRYQLIACFALLVLTEVLYRFTNVEGFNQPFTNQHNFGNYADLILTNKINSDGWVPINCIPTAVHTIAGAMVGKLLLEGNGALKKMITWGVITLIAGYALDFFGITPIIKRIATSSFTLASLGWCLLGLSLCYWWIDIKNHRRYLQFFTVVGMNAIFIYLFFEIVGARWFNGYIQTITTGLTHPLGFGKHTQLILGSLVIFALEWGLCYFLYKKKIFFKL